MGINSFTVVSAKHFSSRMIINIIIVISVIMVIMVINCSYLGLR